LAACELWKRWLAERPSFEMIDDWMQECYDLERRQRYTDACDIWWKVWRILKPRFSPEMRTMEAAEVVFGGTQCIFNWSGDFELCLGNALRDEPRYAAVGVEYCREWIAQFTDESEMNQVNFRRALAAFLFHIGDVAEGEATLKAIVDRWPQNGWGYVALADAYAHLFGSSGPARDDTRAMAMLEQGIAAIGPRDPDREVLLERLAEVRQRASKSSG
jgi:hypothetical protein